MTMQIDFDISEHDDGYSVGDWFTGGWETIERAEQAGSREEAEAILRGAYKGADVDGVTVTWAIQTRAAE